MTSDEGKPGLAMNLTTAIVRSASGDEAIIEVESTGCGRCSEPGGCGGSRKADLFCQGRTYRVSNPVGAVAGERVTIAIAEGAVRRSATLGYVAPLLLLIFGAVLGRYLGDPSLGEVPAICGAILGLATGWLWLRWSPVAAGSASRPAIVGRV